MRRAFLAVVALLAVLAAPVRASGDDCTTFRSQPTSVSLAQSSRETPLQRAPLRLEADSWYLLGQDGHVLAQHDSDARVPVASITKLMTALVALERAGLSEAVTVGSRAAAVGGSTAFLRAGESLTVAELVQAMLVPSANDAAMALALHVGRGSVERFVGWMNARARELRLDDTTFTNPHGLDESGHLSSARDATLLVKHTLGIPFLRDALARRSFSLGAGRELVTTDDLVHWGPFLGGKTGHTEAAGWSQAAAARRLGATVYGAVIGSESRAARNEALRTLLVHGLRQYRRIEAVSAERVYTAAETGYGRPDVQLVAPRKVLRTVGRTTSLVEHVVAPPSVDLPVRKGEHLGMVDVYDGNRLLASSDLVAGCAISEPGLLAKAWWYVRATASNLWGLVT
jgi:D-alanyl-D-alanine carboxypeptidase (penicillin-binding protein 5/6)